jgi:transposase
MAKVTKAVRHLSEEEILSRMKRTVGFWRVQKWLAILIATVDPCPAQKIARHTGLAEQTIHNLISSYNRLGPQALEGPGKGNRGRAYLSLEEEAEFLKPFFERAAIGRIATAREIRKALEKRLGCSTHITSVYRLLKRHGWRKLVPRPVHAEAREERQAEFKKNSLK